MRGLNQNSRETADWHELPLSQKALRALRVGIALLLGLLVLAGPAAAAVVAVFDGRWYAAGMNTLLQVVLWLLILATTEMMRL